MLDGKAVVIGGTRKSHAGSRLAVRTERAGKRGADGPTPEDLVSGIADKVPL